MESQLLDKVAFVVDDDQDDQLFISEALHNNTPGLRIKCFSTGTALLETLQAKLKGMPGLILLDLNMPRMCGLDVLRAIRAKTIFRFIPVIILSTCHASFQKDECLQAGATAFFTKPCDLKGYEQIADQITSLCFPH